MMLKRKYDLSYIIKAINLSHSWANLLFGERVSLWLSLAEEPPIIAETENASSDCFPAQLNNSLCFLVIVNSSPSEHRCSLLICSWVQVWITQHQLQELNCCKNGNYIIITIPLQVLYVISKQMLPSPKMLRWNIRETNGTTGGLTGYSLVNLRVNLNIPAKTSRGIYDYIVNRSGNSKICLLF